MWITVILVDSSSKQQNGRFQRPWKWFILLNKTCYVMLSQWDIRKRRVVYSVTACKQEYLDKYRDLIIQETPLEGHIIDVINRFVWIGSVNKEKSRGRPTISKEVIDDLRRLEQNPQTSLTKFPQQSGIFVATWNWTIGELAKEHFQHLLWCLTPINLFTVIQMLVIFVMRPWAFSTVQIWEAARLHDLLRPYNHL